MNPLRFFCDRSVAMLVAISLTAMLGAPRVVADARHTDRHATFHGTAARLGWFDAERRLSPQTLRAKDFGHLWDSPPLAAWKDVPARLFATPLFLPRTLVKLPDGAQRRDIVIAASTTGEVAAIDASEQNPKKSGAFVWRHVLTEYPCGRGTNGILATPVADPSKNRLFVTSCDEREGWRVHALTLDTGSEIPLSPVRDLASQINGRNLNRNGNNVFPTGPAGLQRGALTLTRDARYLLVTFGGEPLSGWLVVIDTHSMMVSSAFSMTPRAEEGNGGLWGSGGASIDSDGVIYLATGSSVLNALAGMGDRGVFPESAGNWSQSIIALRIDRSGVLRLVGTYTPFNYCQVGGTDIDLGSGTPLPIDIRKRATTYKLLVHTGNKQGNAYLLDRARLPGRLDIRQACATDLRQDAARDSSLLPPQSQAQFNGRGPLSVFGPYSERFGMGDFARSRTTPAYFRNTSNHHWIYATGNSKAAEDSATDTGPGLVKIEVLTPESQPPYLRIASKAPNSQFRNPGSPFVSSDGPRNAIVWLTDVNVPRSASLYGADAPQPVLYAFDAETLALLWRSAPGQLQASGKYNEPTVAGGYVFVGTDRIQAFGLRAKHEVSNQSSSVVARQASKSIEYSVAANESRSDDPLAGETLYRSHCAACHELERADIPPRRMLTKLSRTAIRDKLLLGSMQTAARDLSERDIDVLSRWLASHSQ